MQEVKELVALVMVHHPRLEDMGDHKGVMEDNLGQERMVLLLEDILVHQVGDLVDIQVLQEEPLVDIQEHLVDIQGLQEVEHMELLLLDHMEDPLVLILKVQEAMAEDQHILHNQDQDTHHILEVILLQTQCFLQVTFHLALEDLCKITFVCSSCTLFYKISHFLLQKLSRK